MKLLLDTHILIWALLEPERLVPRVVEVLQYSGNELFLSSISIWEILILAEKGRLELSPDPPAWIRKNIGKLDPQDAPITKEIAFTSRSIEIDIQDPADRFLAATAGVMGLTLVTSDEKLIKGEGYSVMANV